MWVSTFCVIFPENSTLLSKSSFILVKSNHRIRLIAYIRISSFPVKFDKLEITFFENIYSLLISNNHLKLIQGIHAEYYEISMISLTKVM